MGNSNNHSSDNTAQYLQTYMNEQIEKKRQKICHSPKTHAYMDCLCCKTLEGSFINPVIIIFKINNFFFLSCQVKWRSKFNEECSLIRRKMNLEWAFILPTFLANIEPVQNEDGYRTDLILVLFSSSSTLNHFHVFYTF